MKEPKKNSTENAPDPQPEPPIVPEGADIAYLAGFNLGYKDAMHDFTKWMLIWIIILFGARFIMLATSHE